MTQPSPPEPKEEEKEESPPPAIQQSVARSIAANERVNRVIKQHPLRDQPKVDSVEPLELPPK
jgi:hypothetical protein